MAKENEAISMEIDDKNTDQMNPKFSINVLQLLKSAQMQHGLRHGDYTRYRRYCTARLRRLYKSLKFTHGQGKYNKRAITETTVTEVRYLRVLLYTAERAWSHAMEKRQLPNGPVPNGLHFLCSCAYASNMKGTLLFELEQNWAVYEQLGKYGDIENQVLCRERVQELDPNINYCSIKAGKSNIKTSELADMGQMEGPALDLFKAKLEAVMDEARSQQAASMTEFNWLGHRFPVANTKTRVSILKAQELAKDLHGSAAVPAEKKVVMYDKNFAAYHEARSCIRLDLVNAGDTENVKDDLSGFDKAVSAVFGQRTIERNQLLVSIAKSKFSRNRDDKVEKATNGICFELKNQVFRAERCFYLAKSYSLAGKRAEAYVLYSRARSLAESTLQKLKAMSSFDKDIIQDLEVLYNNSRSNICIEHAAGIMEEEKAPEKLTKGVSNISLAEGGNKADIFLLEKLDVYESSVADPNTKGVPHIEPFPPVFQAVPRNPIVLDIAFNSIEFPSLESRMKKEKKGIISRFWG
ncbi:hypothetical protein MKW92_031496 [Papaver armeniacum]|nr:hypothetical protein MKW92_031496 [Papaver armeniacum]